jgi:Uma2 family endonuclease
MEVDGVMGDQTRGSLDWMPTLVKDPPPAGFEELLERRRELGQDLLDEMWEGVYVMNPAPSEGHADVAQQLAELLGPAARAADLWPRMSIFNLGEPDDYRVPDGGLLRERLNRVRVPTAALVIEIVSPGDDTWTKLPFYARHGVDELLIVDLQKRSVEWLGLDPSGEYRAVGRSGLIEFGPAELAERLEWPPPAS